MARSCPAHITYSIILFCLGTYVSENIKVNIIEPLHMQIQNIILNIEINILKINSFTKHTIKL
jgi:hypothetical protein